MGRMAEKICQSKAKKKKKGSLKIYFGSLKIYFATEDTLNKVP